MIIYSPYSSIVEQSLYKGQVVGANPTRGTILNIDFTLKTPHTFVVPRLHTKRRKLIKTFLINRYGYKKLKENKKYCPCYYCDKEIDKKTATIDHKIPIIAGGSNEFDNLILCCYECNHSKDSRIIDYQPDEMMYGFNCFSKFTI